MDEDVREAALASLLPDWIEAAAAEARRHLPAGPLRTAKPVVKAGRTMRVEAPARIVEEAAGV
jgi:hypothetical protein